ncbi:uncharacterized protein LOC111047659 [Nilaparvata lugens]|uniref:uncharacterized protein LOC111047659 n=1 Tax=Nilaparvata lugens TaxID=108931 RepID=UPI00193DBC49|nr:uncharacterized protein LOC111047659 [Nilaparvata lugens]
MVAVSESVGLDTKVRMSLRRSNSSKGLSNNLEQESVVPSVHLSEDDMCRVLDRDQRTVFAPFSEVCRRPGVRVTCDGKTSSPSRHVNQHPAESAVTSHSLSPSVASNSSFTQQSTTTDRKNVSAVSKVTPNSCRTTSHQQYPAASSFHQRSSSFASKLVEVLTLSACVLSLVNLPNTTTAAPMGSRSPRRLDDEPPFWTNPCQVGPYYPDQVGDSVDVSYYSMPSEISNKELINIITVSAQVAINDYSTFIDPYVSETFQKPLAQLLKEFDANKGYTWLPTVPKQLNQTLPKEFKTKLELETALLDSYEYLQRVAVGMEAVARDHDFLGTKFQDHFKRSLDELRTVLCEVNSVIGNFKIKMRPDIERSIMPDDVRHLPSDTDRHIRDWLIFRDYMNVMEFVLEVFTHLTDQMSTSS